MTYRTTARAAAVAFAALLAAGATACAGTGTDSPVKKGSDEAKRRYNTSHHSPGTVHTVKPSCPDEQPAHGVTGTVDGGVYSAPGDPDDLTCLEIETSSGRVVTIRVTGEVYDRCPVGAPYPACAGR